MASRLQQGIQEGDTKMPAVTGLMVSILRDRKTNILPCANERAGPQSPSCVCVGGDREKHA